MLVRILLIMIYITHERDDNAHNTSTSKSTNIKHNSNTKYDTT